MRGVNRPPRLVVTALAAGLLAGCAAPQGGWRTANLVEEVPLTRAFMVPPAGGPRPIAVLERRYANAVAQDIVLENASGAAGQNVLIVRAFGPMGAQAGRERLGTDIPSAHGIRREMRERFPGVHMEISGLYVQNKYGPFGYATGRSRSGATCVYAWQRIAAPPRVFSFQRGAITWRLRLCDAHASARDLLLVAYGLTVTGYFMSGFWNPYGDPPDPEEDLGELGEPMLPQQSVSPATVPPRSFGEERRSRAPRRTAPRSAPEPEPRVINRPIPGAAVVPRPQESDLAEPRPGRVPERSREEAPDPAVVGPGTRTPARGPAVPPPPVGAPPPPPAADAPAPSPGGARPAAPALPPPPAAGDDAVPGPSGSRSPGDMRVVGGPILFR